MYELIHLRLGWACLGKAVLGVAWPNGARRGEARFCLVVSLTRPGKSRRASAGQGTAWHCKARFDLADTFTDFSAWQGGAWPGMVGLGTARHGRARLGEAWFYLVNTFPDFSARPGKPWLGGARRGTARHGLPRQGCLA